MTAPIDPVIELDAAFDRLIAGVPVVAVKGDVHPDLSSFIDVFAGLLKIAREEPRPQFRAGLRARFVGAEVPERAGAAALAGKVAALVAATFLIGSAINPALARTLVTSVSETVGAEIAQVLEAALSPGADASNAPERGGNSANSMHADTATIALAPIVAEEDAAPAPAAADEPAPAPLRPFYPSSNLPPSQPPAGSPPAPAPAPAASTVNGPRANPGTPAAPASSAVIDVPAPGGTAADVSANLPSAPAADTTSPAIESPTVVDPPGTPLATTPADPPPAASPPHGNSGQSGNGNPNGQPNGNGSGHSNAGTNPKAGGANANDNAGGPNANGNAPGGQPADPGAKGQVRAQSAAGAVMRALHAADEAPAPGQPVTKPKHASAL